MKGGWWSSRVLVTIGEGLGGRRQQKGMQLTNGHVLCYVLEFVKRVFVCARKGFLAAS